MISRENTCFLHVWAWLSNGFDMASVGELCCCLVCGWVADRVCRLVLSWVVKSSMIFWLTQAWRKGGRGGGEAPKDYTKPQQTIQSPNRSYKAPTDYTKTLWGYYIKRYQIKPYKGIILPCIFPRGGPSWGMYIQSPRKILQSPEQIMQRYTILDNTNRIRQRPKMFNKSSNSYKLNKRD